MRTPERFIVIVPPTVRTDGTGGPAGPAAAQLRLRDARRHRRLRCNNKQTST